MSMLETFIVCGAWRLFCNIEWKFIVVREKHGKLLTLNSNTTFEELKRMILEDYDVENSEFDVEISFLPTDLMSNIGSPPVIVVGTCF